MSPQNPGSQTPGFRHLGDDIVHQGHVFDVAVARFVADDGHEFQRDVVRHPGAVGVLPLHDDGTVTLVRQYRGPIDSDLLEIPAGICDVDGEEPATTAGRELAEEVGLAADDFELLTSFHTAAGNSDELVHVFLATGLREVANDLQGPEEQAMSVERRSLDYLVGAIERGELSDAKTVIGVLMVARRRR